MSAFSMTGFGKGEASGKNYVVTTEIKSVNNRFKDMKFRMSSIFGALELDLRSQIESEFRRGSFDISINYKKNQQAGAEFSVDINKVETYLDLMKAILTKHQIPYQVSPTDFMRADFFKDADDEKEKEISPLVLTSFEMALKKLKESRSSEGKKLTSKLLEHLAIYEQCLDKVEKLKSLYPDFFKDKMTQKLNEKLKEFKVDESRFMQEVIYYLEKVEIDEEISRARIHLSKLRSVMNSSGEMGRQIDFLLQELGRETNTMGSKSAHTEISSNVVEMKVQLEKIREQALNLE